MFSKLVARQLEEASIIVSAVSKNADQVASRLEQHFAAKLRADQPQPDWKAVLDTLAQTLRETSAQLGEQDAEYQSQLAIEKQLRDRRNLAMEKLRNQLRGARFLFDQTFGKEKASSYFPLRSDLSRVVPRNLLPLARSLSRLLRGTGVSWPELGDEHHVPKPLELAASLDASAIELEASLEALGPERQGSNFLRGTKYADYAATAKAVSSTAAALGGLFRVAGFEYAAKKLRGRPRSVGKDMAEEEATSAKEPNDAAKPKPVGAPEVLLLPATSSIVDA